MNRRYLGYTLIEVLIVLTILAIVASFIWAPELKGLLEFLGITGWLQYIILAIPATYYYFSTYKRSAKKAKKHNRPVIGKFVIIFSVASLICVALVLSFLFGKQ